MSELIDQHCTLLAQWKEDALYDQQNDDILNDFHTELIRLQSTDIAIFRQEIEKVTTLLCDNILCLNESILTFFLDYFIQLLKQWRELTHFTESSTFQNLSKIFTNDYYTDKLMDESLVKEFNECLNAIAHIGKDLFTNSNITVITCMLNSYTRNESNSKTTFIEESQFDYGVIKCLCVPYTIDVVSQFKSSVNSEERTSTEIFIFNALFDYVSIMNRQRLFERSLPLRKHFLPSVSDLLDAYAASPEDWAESAVKILTELTTLFLYAVDMTETTDVHLDTQIHITDTVIQILFTTCRSMKLHQNCIQDIYMGTLNDKILDHLKSQKLTPTMFKLINMYKNDAEIQFNIYRILAAIMTEEDIKRLDDPGVIAKVFLDHLREVRDRAGWETRIKNLLTSLKILLQHDQIRDEVYEQDGVPLFIYCATMPKYDTLLRQRALENLLIMSFNKNVCANLKENTIFIEHIKTISEDSTQSDLQRAAESLLWILTKDETSEVSTDNESSKTTYDVMISYSHKDQDLCFQLYDRLKKDNFRVWLDRDQMHGTPLEAMSNAIEKSEFVFVCMSDAYKQSGYCKMEAYYALERQCCIIPLVMKSQYRPDGWLGIVFTGRMRIDFPKYGFEDAYEKLMIEIDRNRKEKKDEMKQNHTHHHETPIPAKIPAKSSENTEITEDKKVSKITFQAKSDHCLPSNIEQWTVDDVQQFFIKQHLESFLPICAQMKGTRLLAMHKMCMTNSPTMFQSLNNELMVTKMDEKRRGITITEYLQFLEDIKSFVPASKSDTTVPPQSSLCVIL